jgi:hypothetical protein
VHWNRAKFVQVFERPNTSVAWKKTGGYVEITQPLRILPQPQQATDAMEGVMVYCCLSFRIQDELHLAKARSETSG